ncbi:MAG: T9SS type A sorting domain-containing protein, partial [candidate division KSB1 bacterium]|nr:T9SS type A sorting domain-containing protein [candidate division KSB1 bacterium]
VNGEVRASAADYYTDFIGGAIDHLGNPIGKEDSTFRVYKISRGDNGVNNPDYAEWPIHLGAPSDGQGHPLLIGDQTLWCSFVDADTENREYTQCPPLGAEVHLTAWGWEKLDNVIFLRWKIHNKSNNVWKDTFIGIFSDPDMIDANNDLVGSDSTLQLVYCYDSEERSLNVTNLAVGYVALETPILFSPGDTAVTFYGPKINYRNAMPMSPRMDKSTPDSWNDIPYNADAHLNVYRRLQCINMKGEPMVDPTTGRQSRWAFSGDPATRIGWVDSNGRDRRMMISAGPLDLAPGDTTAMTIAVMGVQRHRCLDNVTDIKHHARAVRSAFRQRAALYTETFYAEPGQQGVVLPIRLLNMAAIRELRFKFSYSPDNLIVRNAELGEPGIGCLLKLMTTTSGIAEVEISSSGGNAIAPGNGAIVWLKLDLNSDLKSGSIPFQIVAAECSDAQNQTYSLDSVAGAIQLEILPQPPKLIMPANGQYIDGMKIDFAWSKTAPGDSPHYLQQLIGKSSFYHENVLDTCVTLPVSKFIFSREDSEKIGWFISLMKYSQPLISDTFFFKLPSEEQLTFTRLLYQCDISTPSTSESIVNRYYHLPYAYIMKRRYLQQSTSYHLMVVQLGESGGQVIHTQELPFENSGLMLVDGNRAFTYASSNLRSYSVSDSQKFSLQKTWNIGAAGLDFTLQGNHLFILTIKNNNQPARLIVYQVNSLTDLKKVAEFALLDWLPTVSSYHYSHQLIRLKGHYLYLAYGDLGVFDIAVPESLKLMARVDVPDLATTLDVEDNKVYVANNSDWLGIFNVTSPDAPRLIYAEDFSINSWTSRISYGWQLDRLTVQGDFIYLDRSGDLQVCHYSPGSYFKLVGIFEAHDSYVASDRVYAINPPGSTFTNLSVFQNKIITQVSADRKPVGDDYYLAQNYPNPFNSGTTIRFSLREPTLVSLKIFNVMGQEVIELINQKLAPGHYSLPWDGRDRNGRAAASGLYFVRLHSQDINTTIKMMLLR